MFTKLSQIKSEGFVKTPIQVVITKKEPVKRTSQNNEAAYKFYLQDGKSKIIALAFGAQGEALYKDLEDGVKYNIFGRIKAKKRNLRYKNVLSTSKFDLYFFDVTHDVNTPPRSIKKAGKRSNIPNNTYNSELNQLRHLVNKKKYAEVEIHNCQLVGGRLYRYLGCENCTKSIRIPHKDGKFYCTTCKKKSGEKKRKICIVITEIKIAIDTEDYVENLVIFDNEAKSLLQNIANEFLHDDLARDRYQEIVSKMRFDFTVCVLKNGTLKLKQIIRSFPTSRNAKVTPTILSSGVLSSNFTAVDISRVLNRVVIKRPLASLRRNIGPYEYKLNRNCPGFVLIINNVNFKNQGSDTRDGSEVDVKNTMSFFKQIGYKISIHKDVEEKKDLEDIIKVFKETVISKKPSSLFVFIFSHGENMELEMSGPPLNIEGYLVLNKVNFYDCIVSQFSERNFPEFKGFPKIFFDCSCKVFQPTVYAGELGRCKDFFTDMLICHASVPGRVAYRNFKTGTWLIRTLIEIWMKYAYNTDLDTMMKMVQRSLQNYGRTSDTDEYSQVCMWFQLEFGDFYFPIYPK